MLPSTRFPTSKLYTPDARELFVPKRSIICTQEAETRTRQSEALIPGGARDLLFSKTSQTGYGAQPTAYSLGSGSFPGIKRAEREVDHSPASSAEVKNGWSYTSTPPISPYGVDTDNFTLCCLYNVYREAQNTFL